MHRFIDDVIDGISKTPTTTTKVIREDVNTYLIGLSRFVWIFIERQLVDLVGATTQSLLCEYYTNAKCDLSDQLK